MGAFVIIIAILDIIACITLVVLVALQKGGGSGMGTLAGNFETFLDKTGGDSYENKLRVLTSIAAGAFAVLSVVLYLMTGRV